MATPFATASSAPADGPWSAADFTAKPPPPAPMEGAAQDTIWSSVKTTGARILNAIGAGAQQAWGSEPLGLSSDTESTLRQAGVLNDYQDNHSSVMKAFNEAFIRPVAEPVIRAGEAVGEAALRGGAALAGGVAGGLTQTSQELGGGDEGGLMRRGAAVATGAAGEILGATTEGFLPEVGLLGSSHLGAATPEVIANERVLNANSARASAAVGEGEAGFYDAVPPTPENIQARTDAAHEAGMDQVPATQPPAPDLGTLARRIDPDTFQQYDAFAIERQAASDEIERLGSEPRDENPEVISARKDLHELIGLDPEVHGQEGGFEERLHAMVASAPEDVLEKVANAYDRYASLLEDQTPEMAAARDRLIAADQKMRELGPQVNEAYRNAADMTPQPLPLVAPEAEKGAAGEKGAETGKSAETASPGAEQGQQPRVVPSAAGAPEAEGVNVLGNETLGEPKADTQTSTEGPLSAEGAPVEKPVAAIGNPRAVKGTGETVTRGLSREVEASAIEEGLTTGFGDLPEYERLNMKDQANKAVDLMDKDYEAAKDIAMGRRQPPADIHPASMFVAVEKRATAEGDVATLQKLANSPFATRVTTAAQTLRTLAERDKASPLAAIQEVQAAREADLAKRNIDIVAEKAKVSAEIKDEMKKAATVKPDAWNGFLAQIKCDI